MLEREQEPELFSIAHDARANLPETPGSVEADLASDESTDADELQDLELDETADDDELSELEQHGQASLFDSGEYVVERAAEQHELAYSVDEIIENAHDHFREHGFPLRKLYPYQSKQVINELALTADASLLQSTLGYSVADTYHPHRMTVQIAKRPTPIMAFEKDAYFRHALKLCYEQTGAITESRLLSVLALVRGAQAAANFRPGFALLMYRRFAGDGAVVLDTSTGFGGRLVGFMASRCKRYIGIDPAKQTHDSNVRMASELKRPEQVVDLVNMPAEDVAAIVARGIPLFDDETLFGICDFAFTSPPYFSKEHYSEEDTQSWKRYPTGEGWREGFLVPMMQLQFAALKVGATSCVNIADVTINGKDYPLAQWTEDAGRAAGFHFVGIERFPMPRGFGQGKKKETFEPMLLFRK